MSFRQIVEAPSQFFQELSQLVPWLSKFWRTLGQVEEWHEVGSGGGEPGFENSWVNYGASDHTTAAFYKDPFGTVHIKGLVKSGTINTPVFTLPSGYTPDGIHIFATIAGGALGRLDILSDGSVQPRTGATTYYSINCSFRAKQ